MRQHCSNNLVRRPRYISIGTGAPLIVLRLRRRIVRFLRRGRQRQARGIIQDLPFLRRKLAEVVRLEHPLTRIRRHGAQGINRVVHRSAPVWRKTVELLPHAHEILFLLRREMFPRFHAPQHLMLALGGETIKALQPLFVLALRLARQSAERRVCFKRFPLLIKRALPLLV